MTIRAASRDGYGRALLRMTSDPDVVVLEADLGKSTKSCHFRNQNPDRTFSIGIAEQNMMLVAAGLSSSGKTPFVSTFAIFTERAFEQVRNGIARPGLPVHICGSHGGIHTGTDGSSAQSIEDLAIYRTLPKVTVLHPADDLATEWLTLRLRTYNEPSYTRTVRNATRRIYNEEQAKNLRIGEFSILREGGDVGIIACGVMVAEALDAAEELATRGIEATVVDAHTIKPLDEATLDSIARRCGCLVTAEDHSIIGGLGGAVAEALVTNHPVPLERVGVIDRFGQSGDSDSLMEEYGLTKAHIQNAVERAMTRRDSS